MTKTRKTQAAEMLSSRNTKERDSSHLMAAASGKRKWMAEAFGKNKGALTKKAHGAGESTMAFAREKYHASGKTGRQARAAVNAQSWRKG
jgi:hypothetical protein